MQIDHLIAGRRALILGVPGAFSPVCTREHLPDVLECFSALADAGFAKVICVAPNDPFVLDVWGRQVDPERKLTFLSDGNLDFSRACGLTERHPGLFMGERTSRFLMATEDATVTRLDVERSLLVADVSLPSRALLAA